MVPPVAAAAPGGDPAVDQYVESVPSSDGDRTPHTEPRSGGGSGGGLAPDVRRRVEQQGGEDAGALEAIAGSPALGAPSQPATSGAGRGSSGGGGGDGGKGKASGSGDSPPAAADASPSAVSAVTSAVTGGDGSTGPWLLGGLLLVAAAMGAIAFARRRTDAR